MKKTISLGFLLLFILSFVTACSTAEKKSSPTTPTVEKISPLNITSENETKVEGDYIYSSSGKSDIDYKDIMAWNFGTLNKYFGDSTYGSVIKCNSGVENNEVAGKLVFAMNPGFLEGYTAMKFKIKTENYKSIGVYVEKDGGPYLNKSVKTSKEWQEITVELSSFGKETLLKKCDRILFVGDGPGVIYVTDFQLIK